MEKQEFDQLAQLLFSADWDSVKTALVTLQGVLNDDDIIKSDIILYNDGLDYHDKIHQVIFQKNDVIFFFSFGNENEYISICINLKYYQRATIWANANVNFFVYADIAYCQKGECINHAKWFLYGFPSDILGLDSDLEDSGYSLQFSKLHPAAFNSEIACVPKEVIYNLFNNHITSDIEAELD